MTNNWKLLALDLDGTLLNSEGNVSKENALWLEKARSKGIQVTIASGRPRHSVQPFIDQLGISTPFVTSNGSEVWHGTTLLERNTLSSDHIKWFQKLSKEYNTNFEAYSASGQFVHEELPNNLDEHVWLMFVFVCPDTSVVASLTQLLEIEPAIELCQSDFTKIDINPKGISKASGLKRISSELGIESSSIASIGDNWNDIAMLKWAGIGIAMDNARIEVKEASNHITLDHNQNGVAEAIRKWIISD